jgi:proline-specific peptidase
VIFYDQLGCGDSDKPDDPSLWTVERFVDEVEAVRTGLGLGQVDLYGQSWGGMLAQEYALAHPEALRTLILASTICSAPFHRTELVRLVDSMEPELAEPLREGVRTGDTETPAYQEAIAEFYRRHVCRIPYPPDVERSFDNMAMQVYGTMWGPDELAYDGTLSTWDVTDRIEDIRVPTLITVGAHDELTPASSVMIQDRIEDSELAIFPESGRLSHWEERERYMQVLRGFLRRTA